LGGCPRYRGGAERIKEISKNGLPWASQSMEMLNFKKPNTFTQQLLTIQDKTHDRDSLNIKRGSHEGAILQSVSVDDEAVD